MSDVITKIINSWDSYPTWVRVCTIVWVLYTAIMMSIIIVTRKSPPMPPSQFTVQGSVRDIKSNQVIKNAMVIVLGRADIPIQRTDDFGNFILKISTPVDSKEVDITLQVTNEKYQEWNSKKVINSDQSPLEIFLTPLAPTAPPSKTMSSLSKKNVPSVSKYINRGRDLYAKGKYEAALNECNKVLRINPQNKEAIELRKSINNTRKILNNP